MRVTTPDADSAVDGVFFVAFTTTAVAERIPKPPDKIPRPEEALETTELAISRESISEAIFEIAAIEDEPALDGDASII
ncbi:hypothetical protein RAE21_19295 [Rhodoferax sp. TBRC 17198]|uniref:hypothetical protein n=1 Tax=Rhodoferax potami TaxID=3068338 RepID=UPI0028BD43A7|nr:hypothetical protein [Rhodoferax sp. TBRC 17198]MDT7524486.1 hypothetical protein [Rhodoferax sp. TBRC 17198]